MHNPGLYSISPIDGRYSEKTKDLAVYFSEAALIKYRIQVEVEYFIALCENKTGRLGEINTDRFYDLRELYLKFTEGDAERIKAIEKITNHDVKAVEYFLKEQFDEIGLSDYKEYIHLGLTSQDINNTAVPLSIMDAWNNILQPMIGEIIDAMKTKAAEWKNISMLAHTHGQPASPTKLGKEIQVFISRLKKQMDTLKAIPFTAKFGGATGNFNAHHIAFPDTDWVDFGNKFLKDKLGLERQDYTTQIEHYDDMSAFFSGLQRINTILIDFSRDVWSYISMNYFKQKIKKGEVGSSAMPHKVNPIDFENAEGNLGVANALFVHFELKLPVSRLQRDLTDSTVTRNIGVPVGHLVIALKSLLKGLDKLIVNEEAIHQDLEDNWAVVAEAIQTILRREGVADPYEKLKELTRTNDKIDQQKIVKFVENLDVSESVKEELKNITPYNYTGVF
ncbi:MAG: adenylosuccinate lyase [Bacteroidales bacterium]|nr:adenylosuccinate lyase [Bacteroidales bacterium]